MKPKQHGNGNDDPVAQARATFAEATARLKAHDEKTQELQAEADRLTEALDAATLGGREADASKIARDLGGIREQVSSRVRTRGRLARAVEEAEGTLKTRQAEAAQWEITALSKRKADLLAAVVAKVGEACRALDEARAFQTQADDLAEAHNLPTPGRLRLLLDRGVIRSQSGEELQAALSAERAFGLVQQPAP